MEQHNAANRIEDEAARIIELASARDRRDETIARLNEALRDLDELFSEDQAA